MENNKNSIVKELYNKYYLENSTPENIISSHWKFYQKKIKIEFYSDGIESLSGFGFGDLQNKSLLSQTLSWITIVSYLCQFPSRKELLRLMKIAVPLAKRMGFAFSYDCFRQVCSLNLIMKSVTGERESKYN